MLRKIRIVLSLVFFAGITLLLLDITGSLHAWLGWMAKLQFLPALLALNFGVVAILVVLTLLLGRVYCSVICPLGVMQDLISRGNPRYSKRQYRFSYSPALKGLRYSFLALMVILLAAGLGSIAGLLAPYSTYGRIVQNLMAPLWQWANNALAWVAGRLDSYAFYETEVWLRSLPTFVAAAVALVVVAVLAWRGGRTYCNTVCPVGTLLGFISRFAWLKPVIDTEQCNGCGTCARRCKASCLDSNHHRIDYSRCVVCFDCVDACRRGAIRYVPTWKFGRKDALDAPGDSLVSRRSFLTGSALVIGAATLQAQKKKVDGCLAVVLDKEKPDRETPILPPGALSRRNVTRHCTACQLCVAACPNGVLRPSSDLGRFMQPELSYERGYCRPECTRCSEVCPTGAIRPITPAEKSSTQVGHAVFVPKNCVVLTDHVSCGNCARHCPTGAIQLVSSPDGRGKIPAVDTERCIGCGACEHLCPARPFSAIYVEGHEQHRTV